MKISQALTPTKATYANGTKTTNVKITLNRMNKTRVVNSDFSRSPLIELKTDLICATQTRYPQ